MAGALAETGPLPVSVIAVDGTEVAQAQQVVTANGTSRSFISTEAQTEAVQASPASELDRDRDRDRDNEGTRDDRRRERRVRRQHRRALRTCSVPPTYAGGPCGAQPGPGVPLGPSVGGFLHPPPPHLGLRGLSGLGGLSGLSLGLPFPVPTSVSAFGR